MGDIGRGEPHRRCDTSAGLARRDAVAAETQHGVDRRERTAGSDDLVGADAADDLEDHRVVWAAKRKTSAAGRPCPASRRRRCTPPATATTASTHGRSRLPWAALDDRTQRPCHLRLSYDALRAEIFAWPIIHADETHWRLLEKGPGTKWYVWTVACIDAVHHRILPSRSGATAIEVLGDYEGRVVVDGYAAYVGGAATIPLSGDSLIAANVYAPRAALALSAPATIFGSVFVRRLDQAAPVTIHHDEDVMRADVGCFL